MKILAMDLGKDKSVACVFETDGGEHRFQTVPTTHQAVHDLIAETAPDRVVFEIGQQAGWMADLCRALVDDVRVANPSGAAWCWKSAKRKTDRDDALKLARLSAMDQLPEVHVPDKGVRQWRALIGYRQGLVTRITAIKNSIRAILSREAIAWPAGASGFSKKALAELATMASEEDGAAWRLMLREELAQYELAVGSRTRVEAELDALAAGHEGATLLRTIPGVGPRLAEAVAAWIDDPGRFANGRQVGCYAGLTPRRYQSGSMDRQGRISGQGNALLRSLLVEVAWLGRRYNPWMRGVYERALRGSPSRKKIAIVAVARRLLVVCWAMLRDRRPWRDPESAGLRLAA